MSETEVTKELTKDMGDLLRYSDINFDKKFRRDVIHADTFPIHRRYTWRSRNKNPWTVIYEARGKKDVGDLSRTTSFVTYDMLKGEQVEKYTKNEEIRREIHEKHMSSM